MMTRSETLITMSIAIVAHAFSLCMKPAPRLLWNASESVPVGLYSVEAGDQLAVTNLVVAMPPNSLATFLDERGYVPLGVPLIKRILALRGESVCRNELVISVDGIEMGIALAHDRQGRPLPAGKLELDTDTWQTGEAVERIVNEAFSLSPALIQKAKAGIDLP